MATIGEPQTHCPNCGGIYPSAVSLGLSHYTRPGCVYVCNCRTNCLNQFHVPVVFETSKVLTDEMEVLKQENRWLKQEIVDAREALGIREVIIDLDAVTYVGMSGLADEIRKALNPAD